MTQPELEKIFTYARLSDEQRDICKVLFEYAHDFAYELNEAAPDAPETKRSLLCLQEALLWADAAIAIRTSGDPG